MIMTVIFLALPYVILGIFIIAKRNKGLNDADKAGITGATVALLLMTFGLILFPILCFAFSDDTSANIGWGLLMMGSPVFSLGFIWAGDLIGKALFKRKQGKNTEPEA